MHSQLSSAIVASMSVASFIGNQYTCLNVWFAELVVQRLDDVLSLVIALCLFSL